ncbi:MAG: hypothetical protein ACRCYU_22045 [Nocardioides sp.]
MTSFLVCVLVLVALGAGLAALVLSDPAANSARAEQRLNRDVQRADAEIGQAASEARRAMNRAAGQSWRNRFE